MTDLCKFDVARMTGTQSSQADFGTRSRPLISECALVTPRSRLIYKNIFYPQRRGIKATAGCRARRAEQLLHGRLFYRVAAQHRIRLSPIARSNRDRASPFAAESHDRRWFMRSPNNRSLTARLELAI